VEIIGISVLESFWTQHHRAKSPLIHWINTTKEAKWCKWHDIKQTFGHIDLVHIENERYVIFEIGGNKYRLVTAIDYAGRLVVIEIMLTHGDYASGRWKNKL
jgi:mRNA interferase HigB